LGGFGSLFGGDGVQCRNHFKRMKINEYLELYFSVYPQKYPHFKCHTPCFGQISGVCLPWLYLAQNKIIGRFGEVWQLVAGGSPEPGLARRCGWRPGSGPEAGRVQPWAGSPAV
jgi:hypothetical protein